MDLSICTIENLYNIYPVIIIKTSCEYTNIYIYAHVLKSVIESDYKFILEESFHKFLENFQHLDKVIKDHQLRISDLPMYAK